MSLNSDGSHKGVNVSTTGGCQCGRVRFETTSKPRFVCNCHCISCRKATGGAFSTWVGFKETQVRWLTDEPDYYASSPGVKRGSCHRCGTPITYASDQWPGETHLLIGVFDDPSAFTPRKNVFTEDALPWALDEKENS